MFNFSERSLGEKVVMIGAGALVLGNTAMNIVNAVKTHNIKKKLDDIGYQNSNNQPQNNDNQTQQ